MTDRHQVLMDLLKELQTVTVYDANVPDAPPKSGGFVLPYLVVWDSPGDPAEVAFDHQPSDVDLWRFQITAASGSAHWTLQAAGLVKNHLAGHEIGGCSPLRLELPVPFTEIDRDVTPPRFFIPLIFTCTTG